MSLRLPPAQKGGDKVNKKIEEFLEKEEKKNGWNKWEDNNELLELLRNYDVLHEEKISEHRWWFTCRYTIKVGDTYIGYVYAKTTGDMSPSEAGYDFDPDSICEMKPIQKTITTYIAL